MLYRGLQKASLSRYISFSRGRVPREQIKRLLREFRTVGFINKEVLSDWNEMMSEHNRILDRGIRMALLNGQLQARALKFSSLDHFMLQMQRKYIADILDDFTRFGEHVTGLINVSPNALMWHIAGPILVERRSWATFCRQMMNLLQIISTHDNLNLKRSDWPDFELLACAIERARHIFGKFAHSRALNSAQLQNLPTTASE